MTLEPVQRRSLLLHVCCGQMNIEEEEEEEEE
jgi:hypothetical protein